MVEDFVRREPVRCAYGLPASPVHSLPLFGVAFVAGIIGFALGSLREFVREGAIRRDRNRTKKEAAALKAKIDEMTQDSDDDIPSLPAR